MVRRWSVFLLITFVTLVSSLIYDSMPVEKPSDFKFLLVSGPGLVIYSEKLNDKENDLIYQELKGIGIMGYPVELVDSPANRYITPQTTRTFSMSYNGKIKTIKWIKDGFKSRVNRLNMLNDKLTEMVKDKVWYEEMSKSAPILS